MNQGVHTGPIVIKVGGTMVEDAATAPGLWKAVSQLHVQHPGGVVVVHGGGKAVDRHLDRLGMKTDRQEGIRITPPEQLDEIVSVLAGRVNKSIIAQFHRIGGRAVGLCLGDGDAITTAKTTRYAFDPGRVGDVVEGSAGERGLLSVLLKAGFLPVLSSIGIDRDGFLNINADDAAAGVARAVGASSLVLMTDVPGILDGQKRLIPTIDLRGIESRITSGEITGGMIVKARAAAQTATRIGAPVVILSGAGPAALESWCRGEASGTAVQPG
ncbi:MAG TPA: acetylglutamate kinase [Phycisphaerales bacterium]|nr:acetylglutamate kinase [Phycisphaerales bacterium]